MVNKYYMSDGDKQLSPHFMLREFQSKNGCDEVLVDEALIDMLEQIYKHFNCSQAIINDGYREPGAYCISISGSYADAHAYGMAADVVFFDSEGDVISGKHICCYAQDIGVQGIGYMGNAVHLDTRGNGGYKNTHWWGDETTGANVKDWHSYFGIAVSYPSEINEEDAEPEHGESEDYSMTNWEKEIYVQTCALEQTGHIFAESDVNFYSSLISDDSEFDDDLSYVDDQIAKGEFIKRAFRELLGREVDTEGFVNYMTYGRKRDIVRDIMNSEEYLNR